MSLFPFFLSAALLLSLLLSLLLWMRLPVAWLHAWPEPALIFDAKGHLIYFNDIARQGYVWRGWSLIK